MSDIATLELKLGADVSNATKGLNLVTEGIKSLGVEAGKANSSLGKIQAPSFLALDKNVQSVLLSIRGLDGETKSLATKGIGSINQLSNAFKFLQETAHNTLNPADLAKYNAALFSLSKQINQAKLSSTEGLFSGMSKGSNQAAFALQNLGRVAQDLPFGFIGIQNNLNPLLESFQRLKASTGSTGGALKALGSSLLGAGGIGLALSVASSLWLIFGDRILGAGKKAEDAADKIKNAGEIVAESFGSSQGAIANVQALASAITDTNRSYEERKRALEELQKVNKNYFGDLTLEKAALGGLTAAVNEYSNALIAQATVKGFEGEISKISVELYKQQKALNVATTAYINFQNKLNAVARQGQQGPGGNTAGALAVGLNNAKSALSDQEDIVRGLRKDYDGLQTGIRDAVNESLKFKPLETADPKKIKETKDKLDQVAEVLRKLAIARDELSKDFLIPVSDKPRKEIQLIESAIERLRDLKLPVTDKRIRLLIDEIGTGKGANVNSLINKLLEEEIPKELAKEAKTVKVEVPFFIQADLSKTDSIEKQIADQLKNKPDNATPVILTPKVSFGNPDLTNLSTSLLREDLISRLKNFGVDVSKDNLVTITPNIKIDKNSTVDGLKRGLVVLESEYARFADDLVSTNQQLFQGLASAIGEGLGNAFAGGNFKDIFSGLFNVVGEGLKQFGQAMIKYAAVALLAKKAFKAILTNPGLALAAGIALTALGTIVEKSVPKFAEGGIVNRPTFGLFGEAGPEAIMPLSRLKDMIGGSRNEMMFVEESVLRGEDIYRSWKRVDKRYTKNF